MNADAPTMAAAEVAIAYQYLHGGKKAGQPNTTLVYTLARTGQIPAPINQNLPPQRWRWSRAKIMRHIDAEVTA